MVQAVTLRSQNLLPVAEEEIQRRSDFDCHRPFHSYPPKNAGSEGWVARWFRARGIIEGTARVPPTSGDCCGVRGKPAGKFAPLVAEPAPAIVSRTTLRPAIKLPVRSGPMTFSGCVAIVFTGEARTD